MFNVNKISIKLLGTVFLTAIFSYSLESIFGNVVTANEFRKNTSTCSRNFIAQANSTNSSEEEKKQVLECEEFRNMNIFLRNALSGASSPLRFGGRTSSPGLSDSIRRGIPFIENDGLIITDVDSLIVIDGSIPGR